MSHATHDTHGEHALTRRSDDTFHERLAASMKRHRRILDRLAGEAE